MRYKFKKYLGWRKWVVPEPLRQRPIHRWLVFPHSFTDDIVRALADEWKLGKDNRILDPFVGAGTTVLAAKQLGIPATGFDLCPLATLAGKVKIADYEIQSLKDRWRVLRHYVKVCDPNGESSEYPELVQEALPGKKLATFHGIKGAIRSLKAADNEKAFFELALIAQIPKFSNAVPTGGWLSWKTNRRPALSILKEFEGTVRMMLDDLNTASKQRAHSWSVREADARRLPAQDGIYSAVITSPPYPNRHDYTRVFGIELMFAFLDWDGTRKLRYQTMHSHPEAKPKRPPSDEYREPALITKAIRQVGRHEERKRIFAMLHGYFLDLFLSLKEVGRVLIPGGRAAFVLGNAQYGGVPIEVDKATANMGEQVGLECIEIRIVRVRGNSAQQMKLHGRRPSRESVIIFQKSC